MHKERSNVALGKRILYIILSIFVSCVLWFTISVNEKQARTVEFSGIPIDYVGEDVLEENDLVVTNKNVEKINLRLSGKPLTVAKLNRDDITVTVDMSKIRTAGTHFLEYTIDFGNETKASDITVNASVNYTTVMVKQMVKAEIPVRGIYDGDIAEGYMSGSLEFTPGTIEIFGPEDEVSLVDHAWVVLSGTNISQTVTTSLPFTLVDAGGNTVEVGNVRSNVDTISVLQEVYMVKDIPLTVNLIGGAGADDYNTVVEITPSSITVSGDPEIVETLNRIVLGTIDLTSFQSTMTDVKTIVLPDNVVNKTGTPTAEVSVRIVGLDVTKLSVSNIEVTKAPKGYDIEIITQTADITLRGPSEEIAAVTAENVRIVADLSGIKASGVFDVDATIYIDGFPEIGAIGTYKINVRSTKS
ncbi:MAG: hypothetical protein IKQ87_04905 [Clostridia bacterium]|nr:hypothetical protein [Clostridia bacterium]